MRRIPLSRGSHITGFQPQASGITEHESALERDFVTLVRFADAVAVITSQPVTIEHCDQAQARRYTPDFLVQWSDGLIDLIEVKYMADLRTQGRRLKGAFIAARRWARENGARFSVVTDHSIRTPRLQNAKRLLPLRSAWLDPQDAQHVQAALMRAPELTFAQVAGALPGDRARALGTLWRMIARSALSVDLDTAITLDSPIRLAQRPPAP